MGLKRKDEFRQDAVRIAQTSGMTIAPQSKCNFDERGIAITRSTLHQTCWIVTSVLICPIRNGLVTSAMFGHAKDGGIWL